VLSNIGGTLSRKSLAHYRVTNLCRIWRGRNGRLTLALVIDCYTRELLGWQLSRSGKASTAAAAL